MKVVVRFKDGRPTLRLNGVIGQASNGVLHIMDIRPQPMGRQPVVIGVLNVSEIVAVYDEDVATEDEETSDGRSSFGVSVGTPLAD
jgi:hypothetical protein